MNNLSKIALAGSIVFGAALFSIGCGGNSACCGKSTPPIAAIQSLSENATTTLAAGTTSLAVNGEQGISTDDGSITNYEWVVLDDCSKSFTDGSILFAGNPTPTLPLSPGNNKVCLRVTDNDGNQDITCSCVKVEESGKPTAAIAGFTSLTMSENCPLPTVNANGSTPGENAASITNYVWTLDNNTAGNSATLDLQTLKASLGEGSHPLCLTVTNNLRDSSTETCENIVITHCQAPKNSTIKFWNNGNEQNQTNIPANSTLTPGDTYNMSCAADPACPATTQRSELACLWSAKSLFVDANGTETPNPNVQGDCFANHSSIGNLTSPEGSTNPLFTDLTLCSDTSTFNTIEITLTVSDPNCDINTSTSRRYSVQ